METPYRGLLLYHGLGSGKTCSSIAVAESLMNNKRVFILLPASLKSNYLGEIRKCGDPIYAYEQFWVEKKVSTDEERDEAKKFGLSDKFLDKHKKYYTTETGRDPNYRTLSPDQQKGVGEQIDDLLNNRFTFINYNGVSSANVNKILPPEEPHMFDNSVVIIDEAHNLIKSVVNDRAIKKQLYDMIYNAKGCKVVALSGTPMINRPNEVAFLMNLLKGPIERIAVPMKNVLSWDEAKMLTFFKALPDVDTIEFNASKRSVLLTRNPPNFESVYNDKGDRIAVKYNKELNFNSDMSAWVGSWKNKFETTFGGSEIAEPVKFIVEKLECLPSKYEEFTALFVDGLQVKNPILFQRRIQGLVSYYKGADERLLPKRLEEDKTLVKVPMSEEQFFRYLDSRWEEIKRESRKGRSNVDLNAEMGSFRMSSRLVCNYAIPEELRVSQADDTTEETIIDKSEVLDLMKKSPEKYLSENALKLYSPKMLRMLTDLKSQVGVSGKFANQFVYSQYTSLEGLGIFGAVMEANGFQQYKLVKQPGGGWLEDPEMKPDVPAYALYVGEEEETREIYRQIFNQKYSDTFPQGLKDQLEDKPHRLCVLMASSAGAEGISLENVRNVLVMEAYWNPARIDQVIGRAMRICSHARLDKEDRTVLVQIYLSVFTKDQTTTSTGNNVVSIRRSDMTLKRYEGETPQETFMTSDEFLWEVAYEKSRIIKSISHLLKQAAVDCEIHRKLHTKDKPVIQCMRFDSNLTPDELGYKPSVESEERDALYQRNIVKSSRTLQKVLLREIPMIFDRDSGELFDFVAFEDTRRLLKIGQRIGEGKIKFFTSTVS